MDPVTVVVPAYNETVADIMATVSSATHAGALEVIVVDDGSAERPQLPPHCGMSYYRIEHRGISAAVNEGFRQASTPLVGWLSVGDLYAKEKLSVQVARMRDERAHASFTDYIDASSGEYRQTNPDWSSRIWTDNQFSMSTALLHRGVWRDVGGLDENLQWCQDWEFACKVQAHCGWLHIAEALMTGAVAAPGRHSYRGDHGAGRDRKQRDRCRVAKRWRFGDRK